MNTFGFDTIAAAATAPGVGAVAIVRISGKDSLCIARKIFRAPGDVGPRVMRLGAIDCGGFTEKGFLIYFSAPDSYTGEDVVELQFHGGVFSVSAVLEALIRNGARAAAPGEFTRRAFLNGKMDLTAAEGVADMINAGTEAEARAASSLMSSGLNRFLQGIFDTLADICAELEVCIDYPEEDIEALSAASAHARLNDALSVVRGALDGYERGKYVKTGVNVALAGRVNVGKSSLLNRLAGFDRAIVSDTPGTTRDTVTETVSINGVKFNIIDTAGLRAPGDGIEELGIGRAYRAMEDADIIAAVSDGDGNEGDFTVYGDKVIRVRNKMDLWPAPPGYIGVSALTGDTSALRDALYRKIFGEGAFLSDVTVTSARHAEALQRCVRALKNALQTTESELIATDVKEAMNAIGEITGSTASEAVIDRIFSNFCVGK